MKLVWVTKAEYIKDYQVYLEFNDGITGVIDLEGKLKGPVFEPLEDMEYFKEFDLGAWTISWPSGADVAPEFLYEEVIRNQDTTFTNPTSSTAAA